MEARKILQYPKVFSFSLEGRIRPRYNYLWEKGVYSTNVFAVLVPTDDGFAARIAHTTIKEYELFLERYRMSKA